MSDKKDKIVDFAGAGPLDAPITMDEEAPVEMTADEMVVADLYRQISEFKQREIELEYQVGGMSDMARMNVAGGILAQMVANKLIRTNTDKKAAIGTAVAFADELIQHYQNIIEKNSVEYQQKLQAQAEAEKTKADEDNDTVQ